jgi:hypothetical protein
MILNLKFHNYKILQFDYRNYKVRYYSSMFHLSFHFNVNCAETDIPRKHSDRIHLHGRVWGVKGHSTKHLSLSSLKQG